MARKAISWILDFTSKLPNEEEQIKCLQVNNNSAILTILKFCFDPNIKWLLPEGDAPYKPCEYPNVDNMLYTEARRLYLFVEGGNNNLTQLKRESMFVDLLQSINPEDAKLLVSIKDKKLPYKGLSSKTVLKAFPGLY
jgi:Family of unknown function (DUF6433)